MSISKMRNNETGNATLYAAGAVVLWSTVATAFKLTLEGMSFVQMLFYSSLTSAAVLYFISVFANKRNPANFFTKESLKKNWALGLINPFFYYLVLFKAYSLLPAQEAQSVNFSWPIVLSLFSAVFLKQKIKFFTGAGIVIAFLGVIVITTRGDIAALKFDNPLGDALALLSAVIWASFWILNLRDERDISEKLFGGFFFGTIYTGVVVLFFDSFVIHNPVYLLGAVYIGLFEMGITFFLWLKALDAAENKAKISTLAYLSPFISFVFIALVLKEKILISSIVGLGMIITGIAVQRLGKRET